MKKVCQELIDFFELQEGWDKEELLADFVAKILKEAKSKIIFADELSINDGETEVMGLDEYTDKLFDRIIEGVCNVIETA